MLTVEIDNRADSTDLLKMIECNNFSDECSNYVKRIQLLSKMNIFFYLKLKEYKLFINQYIRNRRH